MCHLRPLNTGIHPYAQAYDHGQGRFGLRTNLLFPWSAWGGVLVQGRVAPLGKGVALQDIQQAKAVHKAAGDEAHKRATQDCVVNAVKKSLPARTINLLTPLHPCLHRPSPPNGPGWRGQRKWQISRPISRLREFSWSLVPAIGVGHTRAVFFLQRPGTEGSMQWAKSSGR
jgi:hypothetical protein